MARNVTQALQEQEAAINALYAIIDVVKNPQIIRDTAKLVVEAKTLSEAKADEAQRAEAVIAEAQAALLEINNENIALTSKREALERDVTSYKQSADDLEKKRVNVDNSFHDVEKTQAELVRKAAIHQQIDESLQQRERDVSARENVLGDREKAVSERENKLRTALS